MLETAFRVVLWILGQLYKLTYGLYWLGEKAHFAIMDARDWTRNKLGELS